SGRRMAPRHGFELRFTARLLKNSRGEVDCERRPGTTACESSLLRAGSGYARKLPTSNGIVISLGRQLYGGTKLDAIRANAYRESAGSTCLVADSISHSI